jgi:site-specific recombinase XerD
MVSSDTFVQARIRLAMVLLYCTGLRISNLLVMTTKSLDEIFKKKTTTIPLIKGGRPNHVLIFESSYSKILDDNFDR